MASPDDTDPRCEYRGASRLYDRIQTQPRTSEVIAEIRPVRATEFSQLAAKG